MRSLDNYEHLNLKALKQKLYSNIIKAVGKANYHSDIRKVEMYLAMIVTELAIMNEKLYEEESNEKNNDYS